MARLLRTSDVQRQLQQKGWSLAHSSKDTMVFCDDRDKLLAIPLHPTRPDLVYLGDLTPRIPVLRREFSEAAFEELPLEDVGLDVLMIPGHASETDIQALLSALSNLNRVLGGSGLTFQQVEAVTA